MTRRYVPAGGSGWLLWMYDPWVKLLGGDAIRRVLLEQMAVGPGQKILDVGCGTASLVIELKRLYPGATVVVWIPNPER